ncbi:hypothetical protein ACQ4PT_014983 [Festuca glaucescens]
MVELIMATSFVVAAVVLYLVVEQLSYQRKKGPLPGPALVVPFLGSVVQMVSNPTRFWEVKAAQSKESGLGLAADWLFGRFVVFIRDSELSHRGPDNIIYKFGDEHKEVRRRIAPNFTVHALSTYATIQQRVILAHLRRWLDQSESAAAGKATAMPLRVPIRDMNLETSQTVFVGPYLTQETREILSKDYSIFIGGILAIPVDLPGFAFRRARLAGVRLRRLLADCARQSKARMRTGAKPECLVDYGTQEAAKAEAEAGLPPPPANTAADDDEDVGAYLFDFLFAAQDTSTSSLCWAVSALETHPDVLARVRAEVAAVWSPDSGDLITAEMLQEMKYTQAVALEVVRHRPPGALAPHMALQPFQLTDWYTVPKGAMVFPSVHESSFQGFHLPDKFDPDRFFSEVRREDVAYKRNFLAFGAGPHQCVGQRYALYHLTLFMALFVTVADFRRDRTEGCDDLLYVPTVVPRDGCAVYLKQRCATFTSL